MIGGGFGGSVLALVPARWKQHCGPPTEVFTARGWAAPAFLDAVPSPAARRLQPRRLTCPAGHSPRRIHLPG